MKPEVGISLSGIAGILPSMSTLAGVLQLHGTDYEVEPMASCRSEGWIFPDKSILRFRDLKIAVVFIDPGFTLSPKMQVSVVGCEMGCTLQTADGLYVGQSMVDAMEIIDRNYTVRDQTSYCIEICSFDGRSSTFLGIHYEEGLIQFIGLYQKMS